MVDDVARRSSWLRLTALGAVGMLLGAFAPGNAPWGSTVVGAALLVLLAASGAIPVATRTGVRGLAALDAGLLAGIVVTLWLRITLSDASFPGMRSLQPVYEWRAALAVCVAASLFAPAVGFAIGRWWSGRRGDARGSAVLVGASLVAAIVIAGGLAVCLGTTSLVIPEGSVILRVTVTDGMITVEPATVPAGEIHVIRSQRGTPYDGPFLESGTGPSGEGGHIYRGPLTDADIAALEQGELPDGTTVAELYGDMPAGGSAPWPTPDEYGGHESLAPGRYAWWTLEVGDFPGRARTKDP